MEEKSVIHMHRFANMKEHRNAECLHQMDTREETECIKYIRVPTHLLDIPSLQKKQQKNRESVLTVAGEKAENCLSFKNMNIAYWTKCKKCVPYS